MIIRAGRASVRPFAWASVFVACAAVAHAQPFEIRWVRAGASAVVEIDGIGPPVLGAISGAGWSVTDWSRLLAVFAEQSGGASSAKATMPAMAGVWSAGNDRLRFEPQFPLTRGVRYRAEFRPSALPGGPAGVAPLISFFELPAEATVPATSIVQVFPTADVLPENQLKFYVQFSAPMSRGGIYDHVHIRDGQGRAIDLPFLELDEELWDPAMTRLTLLIDPGRIKRGVKPLEDIGPVFEAGKAYALAIDVAFRDATGRPLQETFEKKFRIGQADRTPPDPARWKIQVPHADTREPLSVDFGESLDQALALRLISVAAEADRAHSLPGERSLAEHEQRWSFVPEQPWRRGAHRLVVATTIEDLAGNNIGKTFDVDVFEDVQRRVTTESVSVAFEVK